MWEAGPAICVSGLRVGSTGARGTGLGLWRGGGGKQACFKAVVLAVAYARDGSRGRPCLEVGHVTAPSTLRPRDHSPCASVHVTAPPSPPVRAPVHD